MFVGRKKEMERLEKLCSRSKFDLCAIYGRRRVGKTTLINEFCKGKHAISYLATKESKDIQLRVLVSLMHTTLCPDDPMPSFSDFSSVFSYYDKFFCNGLILVIDEFPYLAEADKSIQSVLQKFIDTRWKERNMTLILCGSSLSFMEEQLLGEKAPLYGRVTCQMKLEALKLNDLKDYGWSYSPSDLVTLYAITGGIPAYMAQINPDLDVFENIASMFLDKSAMLFNEVDNLLKEEFQEPRIYASILRAIANGKCSLNEISQFVGLASTSAMSYISRMISLNLVARCAPLGSSNKERNRIYQINDSFFLFYYRFVVPMGSFINADNPGPVLAKIKVELDNYMGLVWERMCLAWMFTEKAVSISPFVYEEAGRWWGGSRKTHSQVEIDILAWDRISAIIGECKWNKAPLDLSVLVETQKKAEEIIRERKYIFLFSKSGFEPTLHSLAQSRDDLYLISLEDMLE